MLSAINHPEVSVAEEQVSLKSPLPFAFSSFSFARSLIKMARRWGRDAGEGGGAGTQDP